MSTSAPGQRASQQFAFELLKLLLQVAWADDEVAPEEAESLLAYGRRELLAPEKLELLARCLAGREPLPPPNLGFLKERRLDVLRAVKNLLTSDLSVAEEEEKILEQISDLLR